jgi:hypothetical protein
LLRGVAVIERECISFNVFPGLKGEDFSRESLTFQADT